MKLTIHHYKTFTVMALCLGCVTAHAFERDGLSAGMSPEEAVAKLKKRGVIAAVLPKTSNIETVIFNIGKDNGILSFCNRSLVAYAPPQSVRNTTLTTFTDLLATLTTQHGQGAYEVVSDGSGSAYLRYRWRLVNEIIDLQLMANGSTLSTGSTYLEPGSCLDRSIN